MGIFTIEKFIRGTELCLGCGRKSKTRLYTSKRNDLSDNMGYDLIESNNCIMFNRPRFDKSQSILSVDYNNNLIMQINSKKSLTKDFNVNIFYLESECANCKTQFISTEFLLAKHKIKLLNIKSFKVNKAHHGIIGILGKKIFYNGLSVPWISPEPDCNLQKYVERIKKLTIFV